MASFQKDKMHDMFSFQVTPEKRVAPAAPA